MKNEYIRNHDLIIKTTGIRYANIAEVGVGETHWRLFVNYDNDASDAWECDSEQEAKELFEIICNKLIGE